MQLENSVYAELTQDRILPFSNIILTPETQIALARYTACIGGADNVVFGDVVEAHNTHKAHFLPLCFTRVRGEIKPGAFVMLRTAPIEAVQQATVTQFAISDMAIAGTGVTKSLVGPFTTGIILESDSYASSEANRDAYNAFADRMGGCAWLTSSGGKSYHLALAFDHPVYDDTVEAELVSKCLKLAIAVLQADPSCYESQKQKRMRIPGVNIGGRDQKLVRSDAVTTTPDALWTALCALATEKGLSTDPQSLNGYYEIAKLEGDLARLTKRAASDADVTSLKALSAKLLTFAPDGYVLNVANNYVHASKQAQRVMLDVKNGKDVPELVLSAAVSVISYPVTPAAFEGAGVVSAYLKLNPSVGKVKSGTGSKHHGSFAIIEMPADWAFQITNNENVTHTLASATAGKLKHETKVICPECGKGDAAKFYPPGTKNGLDHDARVICYRCGCLFCTEDLLSKPMWTLGDVLPTSGTAYGVYFDAIVSSTSKYIDDTLLDHPAKVKVIRGGCGAGKSTAIRNYLNRKFKKAKSNETTVHPPIVIGSRISLVDNQVKLCTEITIRPYNSLNKEQPLVYGPTSITVDSLPKLLDLIQAGFIPPIIILDEWAATVDHLVSTSLTKGHTIEEIHGWFKRLFALAHEIIVIDANLDAVNMRVLEGLLPTDKPITKLFINNEGAKIHHKRKVVVSDGTPEGRDLIIQHIVYSVGQDQKIIAHCDSKAEVLALQANLQERFPHKKHVAIHSGNSKDFQNVIANLQEWCEENQVDTLICSPSVATGVSIVGYFDASFTILTPTGNPVWGFKDVVQAMSRERAPKAGIHYVHIPNTKYTAAASPDAKARQMKDNLASEYAHSFDYASDGDVIVGTAKPSFHMAATIRYGKEADRADIRTKFLDFAAAEEWEVEIADTEGLTADGLKECAELRKELTSAKKAASAKELAEFDAVLPLTRAQNVMDTINNAPRLNNGQILDLDKAQEILDDREASKIDTMRALKTKALVVVPEECMAPEHSSKMNKRVLKHNYADFLTMATLFLAQLDPDEGGAPVLAAMKTSNRRKLAVTKHIKPFLSRVNLICEALGLFDYEASETGSMLRPRADTEHKLSIICNKLARLGMKIGNPGVGGRMVYMLNLVGLSAKSIKKNDKQHSLDGIYISDVEFKQLEILTSKRAAQMVAVANRVDFNCQSAAC